MSGFNQASGWLWGSFLASDPEEQLDESKLARISYRHMIWRCQANSTYPRIPLIQVYSRTRRKRHPEHHAIVHYDGEAERELSRMTYGELDSASGRMAAGLVSLGIGQGDRVAYFHPELPGVGDRLLRHPSRLGRCAVPCNPMYQRRTNCPTSKSRLRRKSRHLLSRSYTPGSKKL